MITTSFRLEKTPLKDAVHAIRTTLKPREESVSGNQWKVRDCGDGEWTFSFFKHEMNALVPADFSRLGAVVTALKAVGMEIKGSRLGVLKRTEAMAALRMLYGGATC